MGTEYIYKICRTCKEEGVVEVAEQYDDDGVLIPLDPACPRCDGNGKILWGYLHDELIGEE